MNNFDIGDLVVDLSEPDNFGIIINKNILTNRAWKVVDPDSKLLAQETTILTIRYLKSKFSETISIVVLEEMLEKNLYRIYKGNKIK